MTRTLIAELGEKIGERVTIRGWVHALRDQKRMQFVIVRDETGLAQVVLEKHEPASEENEAVSALTAESAVTVSGTVVADERVKLGGLELRLEELAVDSLAEPELPVTADSALDKRIDWRYLDLRRPDRRLIFEVQTTVEDAMRQYKTTRDPREPLFAYGRCLAHFAVDPDLVYVTTQLAGPLASTASTRMGSLKREPVKI